MSISFEELLARDGKLVYKAKGLSMEPMLRQNRDLVVVRIPSSRLERFDVALYRRGEAYVLHRVIRVKDNHYVIRGDNTYYLEFVPDSDVIGILTDFTRKGKQYSVTEKGYKFYARLWNAVYPLRFLRFRFVRMAKGAARRLGVTAALKRLVKRG